MMTICNWFYDTARRTPSLLHYYLTEGWEADFKRNLLHSNTSL